jgi:hypothetical protein
VTGDEFSEVDFDLLADYVGGALDGTPEHARVARLISEDLAWRGAHEDLMRGMTAVRTELGALGRESEPMPADLVVRLDDAFGTPADLAAAGPAAVDGELGAPGRHLASVPGNASESPRARVRTNGLKRRRWVAPLAIAAGLIAFVGFGLDYLSGQNRGSSDTASSSAGRAESAPMMATDGAPGAAGLVGALPPAADIRSSGTDYRTDTLGNPAAVGKKDFAPAPNAASGNAVDPLARLRPGAELQGCLDAIAGENGAGSITVQSLDYARFDGAPALVVRFTAANGTWAWASGSSCGMTQAGASTLGHAKVG